MYRVNVYARCTAIKMTGGLSYCLHIVAAISLHIGSLPTAAHYDSSNLTDITKSRQFRQNMEVSKHRDNPHWLENYKYKPLKPRKVEKRPFWESNIVPGPWSNDPKNKEVENWEGMMRKVTGERLKAWSAHGVKGKLDSRTNNSDSEKILQDRQQQSESIEVGNENSENTDSEHNPTILSEDSENSAPTEKSINDLPNKDELLKETMSPYRWGMSKNRPPDHVLKEILRNDIHKTHKSHKISRENDADDDKDDDDDDDDQVNEMAMRIAPDMEHNESSERLNFKSNEEQNQPEKISHRIKINDTTTQLPMLSSETTQPDPLENADSSKNTYEKNLHGIDAIYDTGIRKTNERSRIFSPIIVLGPTIYVANLPKGIKQKLQIHRSMNPQNRLQSTKNMEDNSIQSKEQSQSNEPDFSGIYEFY